MAILGSVQIVTAAVVAFATLATYFFTKLYHARMLILERRREGLVCISSLSMNCAATKNG